MENKLRIQPTREEVIAYAHEKGYQGWKFSPSKLFNALQRSGWRNPSGKPSVSWKLCVTAWWKKYQPYIEAHRQEQKKAQRELDMTDPLRQALKEERFKRKLEKRRKAEEERRRLWHEAHKDYFHAYTDGSCSYEGAKGPGGSAYVVLKDEVPIHEASVGKVWTTSNRMEMLAIISVLHWLPSKSKVVIHSDSQYAIKVFTREWHPKANLDLVKMFDKETERHEAVEFHWVKGHNGNEWNEYVDNLATTATKRILDMMASESADENCKQNR